MKTVNTNAFCLLFSLTISLELALSQNPNDQPTNIQLPINDQPTNVQLPINDQPTHVQLAINIPPTNAQPVVPPNDAVINIASIVVNNQTEGSPTEATVKQNIVIKVKTNTNPSPVTRFYKMMMGPIKFILDAPKVNSVMRNIATCVVNGAVELISYYFPAPLIPVIASVAGMMIPFEPVLMLRDKMPVTSYRRAFMTALNSFLGKFDRYKLPENDAYDPYMLQRFNRRMMNYGVGKDRAAWNPSDPMPQQENNQPSGKETKPGFLAAVGKLFATLDRLRNQVGDSDTEEDPGRRFNWKKSKAKAVGCTNC